MLTLSTMWQVARPVSDGDGGDSRWTAAAVPEKTRTMASIPCSRLRLLPAGGRGRRGEDDGALGLPWGSSGRRRCGSGARLCRGHGAGRLGLGFRGESEGEGEQGGHGVLLMPPRGGQARGGSRGVHGDGDRGGSVATVATGRRRRGWWVPPVRTFSFSCFSEFPVGFCI